MSQAPAPVETTVTVAPVTPAEVPNKTDAQEHMIPKSRMDQVLEENRRLKEAQETRDRAEREQTEKQAREQGKYKELVEAKDRELGDLRPQVESATTRTKALEDLMAHQVEDRAKALPAELRAMMPEGDVLVQFAWLSKAESAAQKLQAARSPGTPSGPRGSGADTAPIGADDLVARKKASGMYG